MGSVYEYTLNWIQIPERFWAEGVQWSHLTATFKPTDKYFTISQLGIKTWKIEVKFRNNLKIGNASLTFNIKKINIFYIWN